MIGSFGTQMFFGSTLAQFATGRTHHNGNPQNALSYNPGADGYSVTSLPELLGFTASGFNPDNIGGTYGPNQNFGTMVMANVRRNGLRAGAGIILTPIAFRAGKKLLRKPISFVNTKVLKGTGVRI